MVSDVGTDNRDLSVSSLFNCGDDTSKKCTNAKFPHLSMAIHSVADIFIYVIWFAFAYLQGTVAVTFLTNSTGWNGVFWPLN